MLSFLSSQLKFVTITIILIFSFFSSKADNGCLVFVSGAPKVYYEEPYTSNTYWAGTGRYGDWANCIAGNSASDSYYDVVSTSSTCYAGYDGSGSKTSSSNYMYTGNKVVFNRLYCPIDDYVPLFLIVIGIVGFVFLRNKKLQFA